MYSNGYTERLDKQIKGFWHNLTYFKVQVGEDKILISLNSGISCSNFISWLTIDFGFWPSLWLKKAQPKTKTEKKKSLKKNPHSCQQMMHL